MADQFMTEALSEAYEGIRKGDGGPFGSVIVKDGKIIGRGHNRVLAENDPTFHGEIAAIRNACKNIGSFDLSGCAIYTTCEPCPMCLGAILWAGIDEIYFGCNRMDAEGVGFRDNVFYQVMDGGGPAQKEVDGAECRKLFETYSNIKDKTTY